MTGVVLALVATPLAGYALVRPLVRALPRSERFAWSLAAGLLIEAFIALVLVEARPGSDFSAPLSLSTALLLLPLLRRRSTEPDAPKTERLTSSGRTLVALAAAGVVLFALAALSEPMWSTDYVAIWGLKAKTIFLTASVPARLFHDPAIIWSRWDYPLLLPLDLAALAAWARGWEGRALALLYPLCQAATAAAAFGFFARRGQALGGAIAAALIAWFSPLYAPVNVGTVEVPLALGFVLLSTALLDVFELGTAACHARLALASLYCVAMKPEGTLFAVLAALLWVVARPHGRALATPLAALLLPPAVHGMLMHWARGSVPLRDYDVTLLSPSRWGEWLGRIGEAAGRIASVEVVAAAVPLAALAAFLALTSSGPADRLLPILTTQAACYLLACSLSAFGAAWLAAASFGRIVCALVPALALVLGARAVPLALATFQSWRKSPRQAYPGPEAMPVIEVPQSNRHRRSFFGFWKWRGPHSFILLILLPALLAGERRPSQSLVSGIRCLVMERADLDPAVWRAMGALGANLVAMVGPPGPEADRSAGTGGLAYIAFLTTDEIQNFASDPARVAEARAEHNLAGFFYWDANLAAEGFTSPEAQQRAYTTLKGLFPDKLVLYPTRLDPIVWSPDFLDRYFRPAFTDLVTPYYYPVGTTFIGEAREEDEWRERLATLLAALAPRVPAGKGILPILQGYEQQGYPLSARFPAAQMIVYRQFWPDLADVAVEAWEFPPGSEPLVDLAGLPTLQRGVCGLFAGLAGPPARCRLRPTLAWR